MLDLKLQEYLVLEEKTQNNNNTLEKILNATEETNQLLSELLEVQNAVREKQRKFWKMAIFNLGVLVLFVGWFMSKYGF